MNPWILFLQQNGGKGLTREQLKAAYLASKAAPAPVVPVKKSSVRGKCVKDDNCLTGLVCSEKKRCKGAGKKPVAKKASSKKSSKKASPPKPAKKEITLTKLLQEFKAKLSTASPIVQNFTAFPMSILQVSVSAHPKFYSLAGKHLKYLREIIPKNTTQRGSQKPMYNVKHGYMYFLNDTNRKNLAKFYTVSKELNELYKGYSLIEDESGPQDKTLGIIGWDVKYEEPQWLKDALPGKWDPRLNPIIDAAGKMYFQKCAFTGKAYENGVKRIQKTAIAKNLYPKYISIQHNFVELDAFVKSPQTSGYIAWGHHARTIYKKTQNELVIIDPWQQNVANQKKFKELTQHLAPMNVRVSFLRKAAEQGAEGSCAVHAFARALMIAASPDSAPNKLDYAYAILASRLLSLGRMAGKRK